MNGIVGIGVGGYIGNGILLTALGMGVGAVVGTTLGFVGGVAAVIIY